MEVSRFFCRLTLQVEAESTHQKNSRLELDGKNQAKRKLIFHVHFENWRYALCNFGILNRSGFVGGFLSDGENHALMHL